MDHETFDRLTRLLGTPGSRRAALGALLATSGLGAESVFARKRGKNKDRGKSPKRRDKQRGNAAKPQTPDGGSVAVEASCGSPGPSSNLKECNFNGDDLDGFDLSSSNMKNTTFRNASLCGADLSSSTLTNADFRNANLTKADLHSSACSGIKTNADTRFCQTIMCNGSVNNSDCPSGAAVCCAVGDCEDRVCHTRACTDSACVHTRQDDGEAGNLCEGRECCNGNCCPAGQKCCGDTCIPNDQCCGPTGTAGCPAGQSCCGGNVCSECCNGNQAGCPAGNVCCGTACIAGACCGSNRFCANTSQCCGDRMTCRSDSLDGTGPLRCTPNEDEPCSLGPNGQFYCGPGRSCCANVFGENPTCEDSCGL